jgi:hypothetical protein
MVPTAVIWTLLCHKVRMVLQCQENVYYHISEIDMPTPHVVGMVGIWHIHALQPRTIRTILQGNWR